MLFPPLIEGRLVRRYKRFLADVVLDGGELVTAAVANTGSMTGLAEPGMRVFLSAEDKLGRKLPYQWLLVEAGRNLVCVDTSIPNRLVKAALTAQAIPELAGYREIVPEMPLAEGRCDFCLRSHDSDMLARCWIEVKAVTWARGKLALFPDAVTARGTRHLAGLRECVAEGERAVQLYIVQRGGCSLLRPAEDVDPAYASALREAAAAGVEILAYSTRVTQQGIELSRPIAVEL